METDLSEPLLTSQSGLHTPYHFKPPQPTQNLEELKEDLRNLNSLNSTILTGHSRLVSCLALTSNGKYLASGSASVDYTVKIWSLETMTEETAYLGHTGSLKTLSITHDNKYLISGSWDNTIRLFNLHSMLPEKVLIGHTREIKCMAVSDRSEFLASGYGDTTVRIWNLETEDEEIVFTGHTREVNCVLITRDQNYVASGSYDKTVRVWNIKEKREEAVLVGHLEGVTCMVASWDGRLLVSGSDDSTVRVWGLEEMKEEGVMIGHSDGVECLALTRNGKYLASGSNDNTVRLWRLDDLGLETVLAGHTKEVNCMVITDNDKLLITGSNDYTIRIWNLIEFRQETVLTGHSALVYCLAITPCGKYLASGSFDGTVRVWTSIEENHDTQLQGHTDSVTCLATSSNGRFVTSGSEDNTIIIWDVDSQTIFKMLDFNSYSVSCIAISGNDKYLACGSANYALRLWDMETLSVEKVIEGQYVGSIYCMIFLEDGKYLAFGTEDGTIRMWYLGTMAQKLLKGHARAVTCLAATKDNKYLASGSVDTKIILWQVRRMKEEKVLEGHTASVKCIVITSDGKYLASGAEDCTVRIWNLFKGAQEAIFLGHTGTVNGLAITDNGKYLASGGEDCKIKIWNMQEGSQEVELSGEQAVKCVCMSVDGTYLISGWEDSRIRMYNLLDYLPEYSLDNENRYKFSYGIKGSNSISEKNAYISLINREINAKYASYMNRFIIFPKRMNLLHICAYNNDASLLSEALESGCYFINTFHGESPLTISLHRNSRKCLDILLEYIINLGKTHKLKQRYIIEAVASDIPKLISAGSKHLVKFLGLLLLNIEVGFIVPKAKLPIRIYNPHALVDLRYFQNPTSSTKGLAEFPVEVCASKFKWNLKGGSYSSIELLESIYNSPNTDIYRVQFVRSLIDHKWLRLYKYNLSLTILYMINLAFLVAVVFTDSEDTMARSTFGSGFIGINLYFLCHEVYQAITGGWSYFRDIWNYIDILRCPLCICCGAICMYGGENNSLMVITSLLCWVRGLTYFRTFKYTRIFVSMVLEVTRDTSSFLILLFYTTLAYATMFAAAGENKGLFITLKDAYRLNLTDFDDESFISVAQVIVFVIASIINCIIMLNLLISILGDSYEKIQVNLLESDYSQKLQIIIELEKLMIWNRNKGIPVYLQECRLAQDSEKVEEWEGRIRLLQNRIMNVRDFIGTKLTDIEEKTIMNQDYFRALEQRLDKLEERENTILRDIQDKLNKLTQHL